MKTTHAIRYSTLITVWVIMALLFATGSAAQPEYQKLHAQAKDFFKAGNYAESLNCTIKALKIIEQSNDCGLNVLGHMEVGKMYYYLQEKRLALHSFFMANEYIRSCPADTNAYRLYYNIGAIYVELNEFDSAVQYLKVARDILSKANRYTELSNLNSVLSEMPLQEGDLQQADKYILEAEKYAGMTRDLNAKAFAKVKRSKWYRIRKDYPQAIFQLKEAIKIYDLIGRVEDRLYMHRVMADLLATSGSPEAVVVYGQLLDLKDSVFKAETAQQIADYKTLYETEKKEQSIKILEAEAAVRQQQIIFIIASSLLLMVGFFIFQNRRTLKLKLKINQDEMRLRQAYHQEIEHISKELHDNVGSNLSLMISNIDYLHYKQKVGGLEKVSDIARSTLQQLRETIWATNKPVFTVQDFRNKIEQFINQLSEHEPPIKFLLDIPTVSSELTPGQALNLFRIVQESVVNAIKHAQTKEIYVGLKLIESNLTLTVSDQGKGFNTKQDFDGHYGLINLQKRAATLGGKLRIDSTATTGTSVCFQMTIV